MSVWVILSWSKQYKHIHF